MILMITIAQTYATKINTILIRITASKAADDLYDALHNNVP